MAEAVQSAVVVAEHQGAQLELTVPIGTEIRQIWELASSQLGIPDDVEAYPRVHADTGKIGLLWGCQVVAPIHLIFAQFAYS